MEKLQENRVGSSSDAKQDSRLGRSRKFCSGPEGSTGLTLTVRGNVGGAAAVAVGGLGPLDVEVQKLHLQTETEPSGEPDRFAEPSGEPDRFAVWM